MREIAFLVHKNHLQSLLDFCEEYSVEVHNVHKLRRYVCLELSFSDINYSKVRSLLRDLQVEWKQEDYEKKLSSRIKKSFVEIRLTLLFCCRSIILFLYLLFVLLFHWKSFDEFLKEE